MSNLAASDHRNEEQKPKCGALDGSTFQGMRRQSRPTRLKPSACAPQETASGKECKQSQDNRKSPSREVRPKPRMQRQSAGLGRGEFVYGAGYSVAGAVGLHGIHFVVVGGVGFQAIYTDAEDCLCVALVQADVGFRGLAQVRRALAVVHDAEVLVGAAGVVASPANDYLIGLRGFDLRPLTDLNVRGLLRRGNQLSAGRI